MENQPSQSGVDESALDEQQQQQQKQDETNQQQVSPAIMVPVPAVPLPHPEFMIPHAQLELGQSMIHPHILGVPHTGLPLPSDAIEEPVYVNAKQYHGILRRRQSRAKAESENKLIKSRKPYLHESRHLHAIKRARGCGGRFLNSKSNDQDGMSQENNSNGNIGQESGLDKSDSGKGAKVSTQH